MRIKVWSVTKVRDREVIGDVITNWLQESRAIPSETIILQSSDSAFHCLSFVMFYDLPTDLPEPSSSPGGKASS